MATIVIKDLEVNRELDKKALAAVRGGDLGGYSGWIGNQYQFSSNFSYLNKWSGWSVDQILGDVDRIIGRTASNPFYWTSPSTALNMYNSGYQWYF